MLKTLKKNKARDPYGFINELFRPETAGDDLINGLLNLLNEIKKQQKVPKIFEKVNITSFYKGKSDKTELEKFTLSALVFLIIAPCKLQFSIRESDNFDSSKSTFFI